MAVAISIPTSNLDTSWSVYSPPSKQIQGPATKTKPTRHPLHSKDRPTSNLLSTTKPSSETETAKADATSRPLISRSILQNSPHSQSASPLLALPSEILTLITTHLTDRAPYFSISFALTCKSLAALITTTPTYTHILSSWRGFRDKEGLYRLLTRPTKPPSSTQPARVSNPSPFLPSHPTHVLCPACYTYRPTSPSYWLPRISHQPAFDGDSVNWHDVMNFIDPIANRCGQQRCPDCVVAGYMAISRESQWKMCSRWREECLSEGLDEPDGGRDSGEAVWTVHPGLWARMNRP